MSDAGTSASKMGTGLQGVEKIAMSMGGKTAQLTGQIKNLGAGLSMLGPAGAVIAGVTIAATACIAAFAAMAVGMVAIVQKADESRVALEKLGIANADQALAVKEANDAMSALGTVFDQMVLSLGAEFAPAIKEIATVLVAFGLAAVDVFNQVGKAQDVFRVGLVELVNYFVGDFGKGIALFFMAVSKVGKALGQNTTEVDKAIVAFSDLGEYLVTAAIPAWEDLKFSLGDYMDQAGQVIKITGKAGEAKEGETKSVLKTAAAYKELNIQMAQSFGLMEQQLSGSNVGMGADQVKEDAANKKAIEDANKSLMQSYQDTSEVAKASAMEQASYFLTTASQAVDTAVALAEIIIGPYEAGSKAAKTFFKVQQTAAVIQVAIDTAQAIMKSIAMFGAPPSPVGIAAMAAAAAIGIAQTAVILSQKAPAVTKMERPSGGKHHLGGTIAESVAVGRGAGAGDVYALLQAAQ
jgi:hypothetical protein